MDKGDNMKLPLINGHDLGWHKKHDFQGVEGYWVDLANRCWPGIYAVIIGLMGYSAYKWIYEFYFRGF